MSIGIVYYSRTGNTRAAAHLLAEKLRTQNPSVDLIEIEAVKRPGFLAAGRAAMKEKELPIKNPNFDLGKYETLIVGSPTWADCCSPFIKTFFSSAKNIKGKNAVLFITGGGKPDHQGKPREMMKQNLTNFGIKTSDVFLGLQMNKGTIKDGEHQIDSYLQSILSL
jgi:flavodoxin